MKNYIFRLPRFHLRTKFKISYSCVHLLSNSGQCDASIKDWNSIQKYKRKYLTPHFNAFNVWFPWNGQYKSLKTTRMMIGPANLDWSLCICFFLIYWIEFCAVSSIFQPCNGEFFSVFKELKICFKSFILLFDNCLLINIIMTILCSMQRWCSRSERLSCKRKVGCTNPSLDRPKSLIQVVTAPLPTARQ